MDDQWLNEAVADVDREGPRPGFEADLRATLSSAWSGEHAAGAPSSSRPTQGSGPSRRWWAISAAAAIVALVIGAAVVMVTRTEPDTLMTPPPTVGPTTPDTTAPDEPNDELIAALTDRTWLITEVDGIPRNYVAAFTVDADAVIIGFDGCNNYWTPSAFTSDGLESLPSTEGTITAAECDDPYDAGWTAGAGVYAVEGDTLTITAEDGRRFDAVDLASLPTLDDPEQLGGTWTTAEGLEVTFVGPLGGSDGRISVRCGEFGTWTFDGQMRATIDQAAYADCVAFGEPSLGWVYDDLVNESPTIRVLPDGSLVFGTSQFGRLLPTETTAPPASIDVDLTIPVRAEAPVKVIPLATIPWGQGDGEIALLNGEVPAPVALFPGSILVLEALPDSAQLSGRGFRLDRSGELVGPVRIDGVNDPIFWSSGSPDGTLYLATGAGENPEVVLSSLRETTPGVFSVVDRATREALGDSEFRLTGRGVELGGEVMIASDAAASRPTVDAKQGTDTPTPPWTSRWTVTRDAETPSQVDWTVDVQLDSDFPPGFDVPFAEALGDGALFSTPTSGAPGSSASLAYLGGSGELSGVFDLGAWQLADRDPTAALLVRAGTDGLDIGFLDPGVAAMDLSAGTLFGYEIGELSPDEVLAAPAPYAPLANDSGWFVTPRLNPGPEEPDCLADREQRVIWWADTSIAFFRLDDGSEEMWSWTTGDVRASGWDDRRQPDIPTSELSLGIETTMGIELGATVDEFLAAHGGALPLQEPRSDGTRFGLWQPEGGPVGNFFVGVTVDSDGLITGIGATRSFC